MSEPFRIVCWNCRRAPLRSGAWDYLLELAPDLALLQEVGVVPPAIREAYDYAEATPVARSGRLQPFRTGLLVKGKIVGDVVLPAPNNWVARELEFFRGNFVARRVTLCGGETLTAISVYCPAFPVDRTRLTDVDTTGIQLTQNRDVWATEILWASLRELGIVADEPLVVGGDLNSSETFDTHWGGGSRGNLEIMERMNTLGLRDCLRTFRGRLTPTFRSPRGGSVIHQLDHLYATDALVGRLVKCDVGNAERIFGANPALSDHLPIVADFASPM